MSRRLTVPKHHLFALAGCSLLTLIFTYPPMLHLSTPVLNTIQASRSRISSTIDLAQMYSVS
jgi:hypothetical protein